MFEEMRQALDERRDLIETRTDTILDTALAVVSNGLGRSDRFERHSHAASMAAEHEGIAAYRDRYGITKSAPLGADLHCAAHRCRSSQRGPSGCSVLQVASFKRDPRGSPHAEGLVSSC